MADIDLGTTFGKLAAESVVPGLTGAADVKDGAVVFVATSRLEQLGVPKRPQLIVRYNPGLTKIPKGASDVEGADMLASAWRSCNALYAERRIPTRPKEFALFLGVQQFFRDEGVSPAAWCAFSFDLFQRRAAAIGTKGKLTPKVTWVFSSVHESLLKRLAWFTKEQGEYTRERQRPLTPYALRILNLYDMTVAQLVHLVARDGETLSEETQRILDDLRGPEWARKLKLATDEHAAEVARLEKAIKAGEWVG